MEIEPYALGVTVICLILNKISEKNTHARPLLCGTLPQHTPVPKGVGEDVKRYRVVWESASGLVETGAETLESSQ